MDACLARGTERADIRGFFRWSFPDNFEWHSGYGERFGLVMGTAPTQRRIVKGSGRWYAQATGVNGVGAALWDQK